MAWGIGGLIGFLVVWFAGVGMLIAFLLAYFRSHRVRIRDPINNKAYIKDYWVYEKKDKETSILYWQSVMGKNIFRSPRPPSKAIETGKRGRMYAEAYQISEDEFIWIKDKGIKFEKDDKGKPIIVDVEKDGSHRTIDTFKPFGVVPREVLVGQFKKAQEIRMKRWSADKVVAMTSILGLVFMVVMLMIFWGDIAKPALSSQQHAERTMSKAENLLVEVARLKNCDVAQTPDGQESNVIVTHSQDPPKNPTGSIKNLLE